MFFTSFASAISNSDVTPCQVNVATTSVSPFTKMTGHASPMFCSYACTTTAADSDSDFELITTKPYKQVTFPRNLQRTIRRHNNHPSRHGQSPRACDVLDADDEELFLSKELITECEKIARVRAWELNRSLFRVIALTSRRNMTTSLTTLWSL